MKKLNEPKYGFGYYLCVPLLVFLSVAGIYFSQHLVDESRTTTDRVFVCYYNTPNYSTPHQLLPSGIHPHLCTHINIAFAEIRHKVIHLSSSLNQTLLQMVKLKVINPKLKILLSVGGAGENNGFPEMVQDHASRKLFIKSIKAILKYFSLDGIDLDWEFPAVIDKGKRAPRERQHFSQLLHEIRAEYEREKRDYLLTVAVAAPETIVDMAYDVDQLNTYTDWVNIMTYDFHFYNKFTPFTGLNSPLFARPSEVFYLATLNINYTVNMYMTKGLDCNKIVVGIPTYGHSFTLVNFNNNRIGSPTQSYGNLGGLGYVLYPDICIFLHTFASVITVVRDEFAKVPYFFKSFEWVSFDDPESVIEKAKFIKNNNLRGAMIYSLSADDFEGVCKDKLGGGTRFPLSQSIRNTLISDSR